MDIAIDCNIFTAQKYGGVSRYLVRLAEEITSIGHHVTVHGLLHLNSYLANSKDPLTRMRQVSSFPKFTRRPTHLVSDLYTGAKLHQSPPDLIHESYYQSRGVGNSRLPRVCTVHDLIHDLYPRQRGRADNTAVLRNRTIARADAVICVSENTRKDLIRFTGIAPDKTHVVHHGYESMEGTPSLNDKEKRKIEMTTKDPYLLYVGGRNHYKNFDGFVEGFSLCSGKADINIVAFGGGPFRAHEEAVITGHGIPRANVHQLSGSDDLLKALYQNALALVYPSQYEGFGFPPLEAMSAGCPVLASNSSCIPEVAGDAARYFNPEHPNSIADAIETLLSSSQKRLEMAAVGYEHLKNFSWRKCAIETLQIYEEITQNS